MKPDLSPDDFARLADLVSQELTPDEAAQTERWLSENPEHQHVVETLTKVRWAFSNEQQPLLPVSPQQAVEAVLLQGRRGESHENSSRDRGHVVVGVGANFSRPGIERSTAGSRWFALPGNFRRIVAPVMATFAAAVVILTGWYFTSHPSRDATPPRFLRYAVANGKQSTITLPDGSQVLLNAASSLEVPVDYDRGNRTIRLVGEALFTVAHHSGSPFTVVAGPSKTQVLGTRFSVRYYPEDSAAVVAVQDGKVSVQSQVLTAMQQLVVNSRGIASQIYPANPARFSFASGLLVLDNVPLSEAIAELNRWFDVDLRLGDPSLGKTILVAGSFQSGSVTDLMGLLQETFNVRVVRNGKTLTIYPNP
jgi:transmembrane sensor